MHIIKKASQNVKPFLFVLWIAYYFVQVPEILSVTMVPFALGPDIE